MSPSKTRIEHCWFYSRGYDYARLVPFVRKIQAWS